MPTLLHARNLAKTYGTHTLFESVALSLAHGDRVGIVGPNGSGKSTLVKILAGLETPDEGEVTGRRSSRVAYVPQDDRFAEDDTPLSAVVRSITETSGAATGEALDAETRAAITLGRLGFEESDFDRPVGVLSGGWRKRLGIARGLVHEPELLILDEPTNHLDLEGVLWLEGFLPQAAEASVFITHDRTFLERVANRIVELSRAWENGTLEVKGNYTEFCRRKEEAFEAQQSQQQAVAGKVRRDTAWLRRGIQGRQTRNKSQLDATAQRKEQLQQLRDRNAAPTKTTSIEFQATARKTKKLIATHNLTKAIAGKPLFAGVDLLLSPGDRLGLLGPNGSGKTTLLQCLAGDLEPDAGTVKPAAELRIVRFTQHRERLDATRSLREALCPVGDAIHYRGKPIHFAAWAKKFLFEPAQFNTSVGDLSGGEQARILIAQLMLEPADVLILDEPTNDLDIASLEVLEQSLQEFPGAVVLVTHDRFMLRNLATDLLALDGRGGHRFFADFEAWETWRSEPAKRHAKASRQAATPPQPAATSTEKPRAAPAAGETRSTASPSPAAPAAPRKLTYKLQRELDGMEDAILDAEARLESLQADAADTEVMADADRFADVCRRLTQTQHEIDRLYARWSELEAVQQGRDRG